MRRNATYSLAALLFVSACATEPEDDPLTGTWTGRLTGDDTLTLELEGGDVITGTASITLELVLRGGVTGVYDHPDVRMTLVIFIRHDYSVAFRWVGTRTSDDVMSGALYDPDSVPDSMTLRRVAGA